MDTNTASTPTEVIQSAISDNRRFQRFIESMPITDDTNKLYRQVSDMINEMWDAWSYLISLPY